MNRVRLLLLNSALGPLDYKVPEGMRVEPGSIVLAPLGPRRLIEWTADYYLAPIAAVLRMTLASASALDGGRTVTEYRATGFPPERLTAQRAAAAARPSFFSPRSRSPSPS